MFGLDFEIIELLTFEGNLLASMFFALWLGRKLKKAKALKFHLSTALLVMLMRSAKSSLMNVGNAAVCAPQQPSGKLKPIANLQSLVGNLFEEKTS